MKKKHYVLVFVQLHIKYCRAMAKVEILNYSIVITGQKLHSVEITVIYSHKNFVKATFSPISEIR